MSVKQERKQVKSDVIEVLSTRGNNKHVTPENLRE